MRNSRKVTYPVSMLLNGSPVDIEVSPDRLLCDLLRDDLALTGTHVGCGTGDCGSCTVLVDGETVRSCLCLAVQADGTVVETIESLGGPDGLHPVQEAFHEHHALQCGFCTPGVVIAAAGLFRKNQTPSEVEIKAVLQGHLCRCTGYRNMVEALGSLAEKGGR